MKSTGSDTRISRRSRRCHAVTRPVAPSPGAWSPRGTPLPWSTRRGPRSSRSVRADTTTDLGSAERARRTPIAVVLLGGVDDEPCRRRGGRLAATRGGERAHGRTPRAPQWWSGSRPKVAVCTPPPGRPTPPTAQPMSTVASSPAASQHWRHATGRVGGQGPVAPLNKELARGVQRERRAGTGGGATERLPEPDDGFRPCFGLQMCGEEVPPEGSAVPASTWRRRPRAHAVSTGGVLTVGRRRRCGLPPYSAHPVRAAPDTGLVRARLAHEPRSSPPPPARRGEDGDVDPL